MFGGVPRLAVERIVPPTSVWFSKSMRALAPSKGPRAARGGKRRSPVGHRVQRRLAVARDSSAALEDEDLSAGGHRHRYLYIECNFVVVRIPGEPRRRLDRGELHQAGVQRRVAWEGARRILIGRISHNVALKEAVELEQADVLPCARKV